MHDTYHEIFITKSIFSEFKIPQSIIMQMKRLSPSQLKSRISMILTYQFNAEFAQAFLAPFDRMKFKFSSKTGKLKYINLDNSLQASYRPPFGTFSLSIASVKRIISAIPPPNFRVQVQSDVSEFIAAGKSAFAKHVTTVDQNLHLGDDVFVVDEEDNLLAIGKLALPPAYFPYVKNGTAVKVRKGINSGKN